LLVVLFLAGYRLLPIRSNLQPGQTASQQNSPVASSPAGKSPSTPTLISEPVITTELPKTTESAAPKPIPTTSKSTDPQPLDTTGIAGIESIPLDVPESYLPYINTAYRYFIHYPDGDSGRLEMVVAAADSPSLRTTIELTHSERHPNDPPGLWVYHYLTRKDGLYRVTDEEPSKADLYLPRDLADGKRWKNNVGSFEVTEFDTTITVEGQKFRGVLAYRLRNPKLDLDQTTWLAPGYGEVLVRHGASGDEISRLLGSDPKDAGTVEALVKKHVVNFRKVR